MMGGGTRPPQQRPIPTGDTALPCPVCTAPAGKVCRALDHLPLPSVHPERVTATPLYDALTADRG